MKIEKLFYRDLPEWAKEKATSDNGSGKEWATYLLLYDRDGKFIEMFSDAMEKEDACFDRDLDWIAPAILEAYQRGVSDANLKLM